MNKKCMILILSVFILITLPLYSAEDEVKANEIDFSSALYFSYNTAKITLGQEKIENLLFYPYLILEIDADIFDFLTLGVLAGYSRNAFKETVDFTELPLSMRLKREWRSAVLFGLNLKSEFFSFGYFSLSGKAEFLYCKLFKNEKPIELPIVTGNAEIKNTFNQFTVDLYLQYDGISGVTLFIGPQLNLLNGKIAVSEVIEDIEADQAVKYKQKGFIGLAAGLNIEMGSQLDLILRAGLFSKTSISAGLFYRF